MGIGLTRPATMSIQALEQRVLFAGTGLTGEYFNNADFTSLVTTRQDSTVNFRWAAKAPVESVDADTFSVRWTGQVQAQYSQNYTFTTKTDDGVRLYVDNQLLIDRLSGNGGRRGKGQIVLQAGQKYDITMEYVENTGKARAKLMWNSPNQKRQVVPASALYPSNNVGNNGGVGSRPRAPGSSPVGSIGDGRSTFPDVEPEPTPLPAPSVAPSGGTGNNSGGSGGNGTNGGTTPPGSGNTGGTTGHPGDGSSTFPAPEPEPTPLPPPITGNGGAGSSNGGPGGSNTGGTDTSGGSTGTGDGSGTGGDGSGGSGGGGTVTLQTPQVVSFTLLAAGTNQEIQTLVDGATLDLAALPTRNLNIRANVAGDVGSVVFGYDANANYRTDTASAWTLVADNRTKGITPAVGAHTFTATPANAQETGQAVTIHLTFTDSGDGYSRAPVAFSTRTIGASDWFRRRDDE